MKALIPGLLTLTLTCFAMACQQPAPTFTHAPTYTPTPTPTPTPAPTPTPTSTPTPAPTPTPTSTPTPEPTPTRTPFPTPTPRPYPTLPPGVFPTIPQLEAQNEALWNCLQQNPAFKREFIRGRIKRQTDNGLPETFAKAFIETLVSDKESFLETSIFVYKLPRTDPGWLSTQTTRTQRIYQETQRMLSQSCP